jgi:ferredoxin
VPNITFLLESGETVVAKATPGETLSQVAYRAGVLIQQSCGGTPSCADCVVRVDPVSHHEAFEPMEHAELSLLGNVYFITKERLACQSIVKNDSTVHVPDAKTIAAANRKKRGT